MGCHLTEEKNQGIASRTVHVTIVFSFQIRPELCHSLTFIYEYKIMGFSNMNMIPSTLNIFRLEAKQL